MQKKNVITQYKTKVKIQIMLVIYNYKFDSKPMLQYKL